MGSTEPQTPDPNRIVRSFAHPSAPTGEGQCFVTADGEIWRETYSTTADTFVATGTKRGRKVGNRIYPW